MRVFSLTERFEALERDLLAQPMRISNYEALPFAIIQYEPSAEWELRAELRRACTRLEQHGKRTQRIALAELLWEIIDNCDGMNELVTLERQRNFLVAQEQVTTYLSDPDWNHTLVQTLTNRLNALDATRDVAFLWRASAFAPNHYLLSRLLDEMQQQTEVPTVLLYPGVLQGPTALAFMGLHERGALGNYRVKIYGQEN
jgi:Domain of unknown function (DUF1788)